MVNSTSDKKSYGILAMTATGTAFGVVRQDHQEDAIEIWQVADVMVDWSFTKSVDLDGAWR